MNLSRSFRVILAPVLFPLSVLYGAGAAIHRFFSSTKINPKDPVISLGNIYMGGTGKTPVLILVAEVLKEMGFSPVVISRSYRASLMHPQEVPLKGSFKKFGDEAVQIKQELPTERVFSGPQKYKTLMHAVKETSPVRRVFLIDDGAQHHRIFKNLKIHVWDLSRSLWSLFPVPLGYSREWWFFSEKPELHIFNRAEGHSQRVFALKKWLKGGPVVLAAYNIENITNLKGTPLTEEFYLISGIGNFDQLEDSVKEHTKGLNFMGALRGKDHDDFSWFQASKNSNYVCTLKDVNKLKEKVGSDHLYVVRSSFSPGLKNKLKQVLQEGLVR